MGYYIKESFTLQQVSLDIEVVEEEQPKQHTIHSASKDLKEKGIVIVHAEVAKRLYHALRKKLWLITEEGGGEVVLAKGNQEIVLQELPDGAVRFILCNVL